MNPYDRRRRRQGQHVPLELARKLKAERDRLATELETARRVNDRLSSELDAERVERDALESRLEEARHEVSALEDRLEAERHPTDPDRGRGDEPAELERADEEQQIARLSRRVAELTTDLERVQQRTATTVQDARREERARILAGLGDVLDSVDRALEMGADGPWRQGLTAIRDQLFAFMRTEGASLTGAVGEAMDPRLHEAIAVVDDPDFQKGEIVTVDRHGLELEDGTVVRAAQVRVAA